MRMAEEFEMFNFLKFKKFCENEDGAVAVDWVVLSAAIIGACGIGRDLYSKRHSCRSQLYLR